jgi:hypothetical protein
MPTEEEESMDFLRFFRRTFPGVLIYHIPNGGRRGKSEALRLKCMGVTPGIPDYHCPQFKWWGELKTQNGGDGGSSVQKEMILHLKSIGHIAGIYNGSEAAKEAVIVAAKESGWSF